jgi:4-hydroxy-tetrahydrodipicolinate synthase
VSRARPAGTFVASITPFAADGQLDEEAFRAHLRRMGEAGIGVLVGGGGIGEGFTLSLEEVRRVCQIAKEELQGKVPVGAMAREPRTAQEMIEYAKVVEEVGLDAFQVHSLDPGHGLMPAERDIERYLTDVLSAVSMPSVISVHRGVHYLPSVRLIGRMVDRYDQVIGVNCATDGLPNGLRYLTELIDTVGEKVEIHVGGPAHALNALALGASGWISAEGNLAPRLTVSTTDHHNAGELAERDAAFAKLLRFERVLGHSGVGLIKAALRLLGLPGGHARRPWAPLPDEQLPEVARALEELDVLSVDSLKFATAGLA